MPKIPPSLQEKTVTSKLKTLMTEIVDRPVVVNPSILLHPQIPKRKKHIYREKDPEVVLASDKERFWLKVDKIGESDCWLWVGGRYSRGYGQFWRIHGSIQAHRFSWLIHNGNDIPRGMVICHTCDVPLCVNPKHLFLGTHADNKNDSVSKMRHAFGERVNTAKLKEFEVIEIRRLHAKNTARETIEALFPHITPRSIDAVIKRLTWKYLP